jgi:hypothetical protein
LSGYSGYSGVSGYSGYSGTTGTLATVSSNSTTLANSTYTMTSTIPVEFESSDSNTLVYIDETNEKVGLGTSITAAKVEIGNIGTDPPLGMPNSGSAATTNLASGKLQIIDRELYTYDGTRAKWLSVSEWSLQYGRNGNSDGVYLNFGGDESNGTSGARMPRNGTMVAVTALSSGGNATKSFDVEVAGAVAFSFSMTANAYTSTTDNINFSANDRINVFASAAGTAVADATVILWIRWR